MSSPEKSPIAVLGAGSWGTALAILLANNGQRVKLWGYDSSQVEQMARDRTNARYLPNIPLPPSLQLSSDLAETLADTQDVLLVVPSYAFTEVLIQAKPHLLPTARLVWGTKGLTVDRELLHIAAARILDAAHPLAVLSGPSFASEVARGLPTAVTVAATDPAFASDLITRFNSNYFRVYTVHDITGVEVCGVVKNILAIAAGIVDGLHLGANATGALITRGLAEMKRLGIALGGHPETFTGLAGLGDLVLTCTGGQSRNRRFGYALGEGKTAEAALKEIGQAVEGYRNLEAAYQLAQELKVSMPITEQVYQIVFENKSPKTAVQALFSREPKNEMD